MSDTENTEKLISATIPLESGFTHILFNLAAQNISCIKIVYSGGGDSGAIDEVYAIKRGDIDLETFQVASNSNYYDVAQNLQEVIEDYAHRHILENFSDWWNNDGGGGTLYICCDDASYHSFHHTYYMETIDEQYDGKLND